MKARISPDTGLWEYSPTGELRKGWRQFVITAKPTVLATQVAERVDPVVVGPDAVETWTVRLKTPEEVAADTDALETAQAKAALPRLKNPGTDTLQQQVTLLQKVAVKLIEKSL